MQMGLLDMHAKPGQQTPAFARACSLKRRIKSRPRYRQLVLRTLIYCSNAEPKILRFCTSSLQNRLTQVLPIPLPQHNYDHICGGSRLRYCPHSEE